MTEYKHIISLGHYCGVAKELERIGLRDASYPFDWVISEWQGVEILCRNHFKEFLQYENLWQYKSTPRCYRDEKLKISFFHDFNKYKTLDEQLELVKDKYERRIERFYQNIQEPTLFIRYFMKEEEISYCEQHYEDIIELFKQYHPKNSILFINTFSRRTMLPNTFYVTPDEGDRLARELFLEKMPELKKYLMSNEIYDLSQRQKNMEYYQKKRKKSENVFYQCKDNMIKIWKKIFLHTYLHSKVIDS